MGANLVRPAQSRLPIWLRAGGEAVKYEFELIVRRKGDDSGEAVIRFEKDREKALEKDDVIAAAVRTFEEVMPWPDKIDEDLQRGAAGVYEELQRCWEQQPEAKP